MIKIEFLETSGKPSIEIDAKTLKEALEIAAKSRTDLSYAVLSEADLHGAFLRKINLCGAVLKNARLQGADLMEADLTGADLTGANLSNAEMRYATLEGACLNHADLRESSLYITVLRGAFLAGAVLDETNLHGADFTGADLDYSGLPLWCGSLHMKIDKRIFCQLLYHAMSAGRSVDDEEVRKLFTIPEVVNLANRFHRVDQCGRLRLVKKDTRTTRSRGVKK